jgi:hypothetical protein
VDDVVADALSRRSHSEEAHVLSLSTVVPVRLESLQSSYENDEKVQELLVKLALDSNVVPHFTLHNGVLKYTNRIWLASCVALQTKVLLALHDAASGGHSHIEV